MRRPSDPSGWTVLKIAGSSESRQRAGVSDLVDGFLASRSCLNFRNMSEAQTSRYSLEGTHRESDFVILRRARSSSVIFSHFRYFLRSRSFMTSDLPGSLDVQTPRGWRFYLPAI
jgi:hypothetical protein